MTGNGTLIVHMPVQHATTAPPRHTKASMDKIPLTLQVSLFINIEIEMRNERYVQKSTLGLGTRGLIMLPWLWVYLE